MSDNYIDTLNKEERALYDSWSKESVYEAYMSEYKTRIRLNEELNEERRRNKEIKWKLEAVLSSL